MRLNESKFGPNRWLIDEMYRLYLEDPDSVGEAWKEFFVDYSPPADGGPSATAPKPSAEAAPMPEPVRPAPAPGVRPPLEAEDRQATLETPGARRMRGIDAVIAQRMDESIAVPTATSVRTIPAKLLEVNRNILNRHLARSRGAKVSFTHLIGWAFVRALAQMPGMRVTYESRDGKPHLVPHDTVNLGLAVDTKRPDGTRTLIVPNIKGADGMDFSRFFGAYEEMIRKVKQDALTPDDFAGTTHTITNPGMIGTVQSVPRLMPGQSAIFGVGAIDYPAEFEGADPRALSEFGVGKVVTLTSTYDHRVIQGAESGEFLRRVHDLLLGEDEFYDDIFRAVGVPYVPVRWRRDVNPMHETVEAEEKQGLVLTLINMYRVRGHLIAPLDPLQAEPPRMHPELEPASYGFTIWDLDREFVTGGLAGLRKAKLSEILRIVRDAYCRTATVEYMHMQDPAQKQWIQERIEGATDAFSAEERQRILTSLNQAEAFERFLHQKYVGHKRFSLEGAESLIPMLDTILDDAAEHGVLETVIGMSHRGRLNVLANIVGKSYTQIFREFEGSLDPNQPQGSGDVKYHMGATGRYKGAGGNEIVITVASNPSHLEAVDPVVEGMVRAKQDFYDMGSRYPVLPLLIHGDAAFAGQGVVAETLNLSQLTGYRTGGTVHIIVNNQVGFTTGPQYARSSTYASDVARMIQAPIFHVNGDDPEACVRVARLALAFRQAFKKDVVIDMWCYRRWGHNEADDPSMTQPLMYRRIENRRSVRKLYTEALVNRGDLSLDDAERVLEEFQDELRRAFEETKQPSATPAIEWKKPAHIGTADRIETSVDAAVLKSIVDAVTTVPEGFNVHRRLVKWLDQRRGALDADAVDWSLAEALAFGSLLLEGRTVRLSGEDSRRGTFSQRHAVLVDQETGAEYTPLAQIPGAKGKFLAYDSLLSEFAVVGFEYGYSVSGPDALVCWEAQFGDFVNGAQVIIDQFLAAAEDKWGLLSRLVLLLPHGYEGQGPEHSSARLERFLELASEDNMLVTYPSTPAQYFHLLRRQVHMRVPKPLVVLTPKSLLRLPAARSAAAEFTDGGFARVVGDPQQPEHASRVILCQGKVYYDLAERRKERGLEDEVALVRVEQLYPFPKEELGEQLERYADVDQWCWVQEEPENMGALRFVQRTFRQAFARELQTAARAESASPATGSAKIHQREQSLLLDAAFTGLE